jgi:cytochrome c peroxidase
MVKVSLIVSGLLLISGSTFANADASLLKAAKDAGLKAIPTDKKELLKLVEDKTNVMTKAKIELGKKLYFEPRLSKSNLISCNTCHNLAIGGVDGVGAAIGHKWTANPHHLNSPTVYNSVLNKEQFWDGRSPHLEDQAQGPIQAGPEMAAPSELVLARVVSMPEYVEHFKKAYGKDVKITFKLIADTIGLFERTLITPSRFDAFMAGNLKALNKAEKDGLKVFINKGCTSCHTDIGLGGTMQPFQVHANYSYAKGDFKGNDKGMVKTPTLRNIQETAPYFHNGNVWSLSDAVKEMGSIQLGIKITDSEASQIVTFLNSLTGKKPTVTYPVLPVISNKTPKPEFN